MYNIKNSIKLFNRIKSFSLVELVIVMIILAILAVIAVMTVTSWIGKSRDSRRKMDISSLNQGFNIYIAEKNVFPDPDNAFEVKDATGAIAWYQGVLGSGVKANLQTLKKEPKDPTGSYYGYSITADKKKYQVKALLEKGETYSIIFDKTYASTPKYAHIKGPYDGWIVTHTGGTALVPEYYMLWQVPSLFIEDSRLIDGFRLTGGNLPVLQDGKDTTTNFLVKQLTVTPLYDNDTTNDGLVLSYISSTFSGYDGNNLGEESIKQIFKKAPGVNALLLEGNGGGTSSNNGLTYTLSGSFGSGGAGATVSGCGKSVTANNIGNFSFTGVSQGTSCNNIIANRTYYTCSTIINGPSSLLGDNGTIIGNCSINISIVKDIYTGTNSSGPHWTLNSNGILYFGAKILEYGYELRKSDGTLSGTVLVKDICVGTCNSLPRYIININGIVYFSASNGTKGTELWRSDGTSDGTYLVKDIYVGSDSSRPRSIIDANGILYFGAQTSEYGDELRKSDGTLNGTVLVKDIYAGINGSSPNYIENVNGIVYFQADDGVHGTELWKSDGTSNGTVLVKDIYPGSDSSSPNTMKNINGIIYFSANDGINGEELRRSDGTTDGTYLVKDIYPGSDSSSIMDIENINGIVYISADDGVNGEELRRSDGTIDGTYLVKDIYAGTNGSSPYFMKNINGILYFSAQTSEYGYELRKSDGTLNGTVLVKDIYAGTNGSSPTFIENINGTIYFTSNTSTYGAELWKITP